MEQNNHPAAADATVDHDAHQDLLDDLMGRVASCFARRETRVTCRDMVHGLLAEVEDHNCWTMAEAAGHPGPHRMQHLLSRARVDEQQMLDAAAGWAAGRLSASQDGDASDAVLIVDETADEKSSADCVGAACQYSGTVGGTALCQVAVTLTYAAPGGHALIGRALYLPEGWAADDERRELAGVPDDVMFETKPQLAGHLLQHAHDRGIRAAFVAGDEVYGGHDLRQSIRERGTGYVLAVRSNYMVTLPSGRRVTVKNAAGLVKPGMWQRMRTGSATKGARDYHWAMIEVTPDDTPAGHDDGHAFLLLRRHRYTGTVSYFLCWSPAPVPLGKLISVAVARWRIEEDHQLENRPPGSTAASSPPVSPGPLDRDEVTIYSCRTKTRGVAAVSAMAIILRRSHQTGTHRTSVHPAASRQPARRYRVLAGAPFMPEGDDPRLREHLAGPWSSGEL